MIMHVHALNNGVTVNSNANGSAAEIGMSDTHGTTFDFASLVAGLLGGKTASEAQGTSESAIGSLANPLLLQLETEEQEVSSESLDLIVEQLVAWLDSLSSEERNAFAELPQVSEWLALASAELMMASVSDEEKNVAASIEASIRGGDAGKQLGEVLKQLSIIANAERPHLAAVVQQALKVFTQEAGGNVNMNQISRLFTQLNGTVSESGAVLEQAEGNAATGRWSHLNAMQAKTAWVRMTVAESTQGAAGAEKLDATIKLAGTSTTDSNGMPAMNGSDLQKPVQAETAARAEAMPRMPLPEATERLNAWMLKQAASGTSMRAETVLRLMPEHLGQVEVKLSMQNGQLAATITAESALARDALESNLAVLRASLQNQGVTVERLVVAQQPANGTQSGQFQDGGQQRQPADRNGTRDQRDRKEQDVEDWANVLAGNTGLDATELERGESSFRAEA